MVRWFHASGEGLASASASSTGVVAAPVAMRPVTTSVAVEFHAKVDHILISRARDNHQASREIGAQHRAITVRVSNHEETIDVSPKGKMRPTRSCSQRTKSEASESSAAVAAPVQKEDPDNSGAEDKRRARRDRGTEPKGPRRPVAPTRSVP